MSNKINTVLYTGMTDSIERRVSEHKGGEIDGFTKKYKVHKLVYYEEFSDSLEAIAGEKKIKGWSRWKKVQLIQKANPIWKDLSLEWDSSADASE